MRKMNEQELRGTFGGEKVWRFVNGKWIEVIKK